MQLCRPLQRLDQAARTRPRRAAGRPTLLRVVAFREDERGSKDRAERAASEAREAMQRGRREVGRRINGREFEQAAAEASPQVYSVNALALAAAAGLAAYSPFLAAKVLFAPSFIAGADAPGLLPPLVRLLSLGISAAAVINCVQAAAASNDDLDEERHRRLNAGLSTFSVATLALLGLLFTPLSSSVLRGYSGSEVLNTTGAVALVLAMAAQLYVAGVNYARTTSWGYSPVSDVKSWLRDAANTFSGVNGLLSGGYALVTASLLAAGVGYLVAPLPTLAAVFGSSAAQAGPEAVVLWQLVGASVSMLLGPAAYSLKEGAAASSLSDSRYKLLNIALLTAGVGHWLVLSPRLGSAATAGPLMPAVLATWAAAAMLGGIDLLQRPRRA